MPLFVDSTTVGCRELASQPIANHRPLGLHRAFRNSQNLGNFLHGKTTEKPQLNNSRLTSIPFSQLVQRFVNCEQIFVRPCREL